MALRTLTFEGTSSSTLHDMTVDISGVNVVLVNARVDIDTSVVSTHKSLNLQIGSTINTNNCIDSSPSTNYLKMSLDHNLQVSAGASGGTVTSINSSSNNPNVGYMLGGHLGKQCQFNVRDINGDLLGAELVYYFFQFQVL